MLKITGYSDRIFARPGETVRFMVNCDGPATYQADIVRIVCGDTAPQGPGYKETLVRGNVSGRHKGRRQVIHAGSHGVVPAAPALDTTRGFTVQAYIWPTTPTKGEQGLISRWSSRRQAGFALMIDRQGAIALRLGAGKGKIETISTGARLLDRHWHSVGATYDVESGKVTVFQEMLREVPGFPRRAETARKTRLRPIGVADRPLIMAAIEKAAEPRLLAGQMFNGKIDRPRLANRALDGHEIETLASDKPGRLGAALVAAWDFSRDISGETVSDISANGLHGETINLPTRAVTGFNWTGEVMDWRARPAEWGAIQFHDDDLYDAGWEVDFEFKVPVGLKSGVYAARLRGGGHEEYIPFAVGPRPGQEKRIAFLMPTASYMAYANEHNGVDAMATELTCNTLCTIYPKDMFLNEHREYGLSHYDLHSDGTGVCYSSRLRPVLNMRPKCESVLGGIGPSRLWQFNADTHILDWLEAMGHDHDVITDEELHRRGLELLAPYNVILTGTHPEYWSVDMWNAMDAYKRQGGRLMYLGGNGFYWRVAYHPTKPGVIELRRNEGGIRAWFTPPGEYYHSFDGQYGGLWLNQGKAPQAMVGAGMCTQGFDISSYYRRKPDSFKPEVRFIFKGVGRNERIGDFGLIGGGAAGLELDRFSHALGTPRNAYLLASSENHTDTYWLTVEELPESYPGLGGQEQGEVRADIVYFTTPKGGGVFSVSSMAWAGSLSHDKYRNNVARITDNVLRRFVNPKPL